MRRRLQELADVNRKLAEYENRIALMSQEIERLNGALRTRVEELSSWESKFRAVQVENDGLKRAQADMEYRIREEMKVQIGSYESQFIMANRQNEELANRNKEYENKITMLIMEVERLNGNLKNKLD